MGKKIDFSKMSNSNVAVNCWLLEETVQVNIRIANSSLSCEFDQLGFWKEFLDLLPLLKISSFTLTIYSAGGEITTFNLSDKKLKDQYSKWNEDRPALLKDIKKILKLK